MFIVFDLDSTLADTAHRQHILDNGDRKSSETWNAFFDACDQDPPIQPIIDVLHALSVMPFHRVEIWTGRSDRVREKTMTWLHQHVSSGFLAKASVRMRPEGDHRSDTELKIEWMDKYGKPDLMFDDRTSAVQVYREKGIRVCQVAPNDF